jgi:hypothetical protein
LRGYVVNVANVADVAGGVGAVGAADALGVLNDPALLSDAHPGEDRSEGCTDRLQSGSHNSVDDLQKMKKCNY